MMMILFKIMICVFTFRVSQTGQPHSNQIFLNDMPLNGENLKFYTAMCIICCDFFRGFATVLRLNLVYLRHPFQVSVLHLQW